MFLFSPSLGDYGGLRYVIVTFVWYCHLYFIVKINIVFEHAIIDDKSLRKHAYSNI